MTTLPLANRRTLIKLLAASSAAPLILPHRLFGADAPSGKVTLGCIGVGWQGGGNLDAFLAQDACRVVAICDVDKNHLDKAAALVPDARRYTDWREMLAQEGDKIDSVNASVPDHMHALIATKALEAGKHVYCQKPLCHEIEECRLLRDTAARMNVVRATGPVHGARIVGD